MVSYLNMTVWRWVGTGIAIILILFGSIVFGVGYGLAKANNDKYYATNCSYLSYSFGDIQTCRYQCGKLICSANCRTWSVETFVAEWGVHWLRGTTLDVAIIADIIAFRYPINKTDTCYYAPSFDDIRYDFDDTYTPIVIGVVCLSILGFVIIIQIGVEIVYYYQNKRKPPEPQIEMKCPL